MDDTPDLIAEFERSLANGCADPRPWIKAARLVLEIPRTADDDLAAELDDLGFDAEAPILTFARQPDRWRGWVPASVVAAASDRQDASVKRRLARADCAEVYTDDGGEVWVKAPLACALAEGATPGDLAAALGVSSGEISAALKCLHLGLAELVEEVYQLRPEGAYVPLLTGEGQGAVAAAREGK